MEFIIALPTTGSGSPVRKAGIEVMSKTKLPSVEELLERKNWTGLTARELAKAGRIGDPGEAAANIVRHLDLVTGPFGMGLDDMVWDLIDELRGLEDDLAAELKRLSEEKKPAEEKKSKPQPKSWGDQPEELEGLPILFSFCRGERMSVEARRDNLGRYYLTVGSLFRSETRHFDDLDEFFAALKANCSS